MKALLLYSSKTGSNKSIKLHDKIMKKLSSKFEISSHYCHSLSELENEITNSLKNYKYLFICGGDGTLNHTVNMLMSFDKEDRPVIGYIPTGTMNDAGKTYGIRGINKAIDIILQGNIVESDIGKINDKYFVYLAAYGQYSDISYAASRDNKKKIGKLSYYKLAVQEAFQSKRYKLSIEYDGKVEEYITPFIIIMNGTYVGGFKVNFCNRIDDGLVDIYITKPGIFNGLVHYFPFKTKTKHILTSQITIKTYTDDPWCLDGEKVDFKYVNITCLYKQISIFAKAK